MQAASAKSWMMPARGDEVHPLGVQRSGRERAVIGRLLHAVAEDDRVTDPHRVPERADEEAGHEDAGDHHRAALVVVKRSRARSEAGHASTDAPRARSVKSRGALRAHHESAPRVNLRASRGQNDDGARFRRRRAPCASSGCRI